MSTVRPILFSAPMVRALLAGDKTQTRRVLSPGNIRFWRGGINEPIMKYKPSAAQLNLALSGARNVRFLDHVLTWDCADGCYVMSNVTYAPGDLLWVRENWRTPSRWDDRFPGEIRKACIAAGYDAPWAPVAWEADGRRDNWCDWRSDQPGGLRPGIHLPKEFSRLTLEVTHVRVERVQGISEADAEAEGVEHAVRPFNDWKLIPGIWDIDAVLKGRQQGEPPSSIKYAYLWNTINTRSSTRWADDPWVVAVTFTVHQINIDVLLRRRSEGKAA